MLLALLGGLSLQEEALPLNLRSLIPPAARFVRKELPAAQNAYPALLRVHNEQSKRVRPSDAIENPLTLDRGRAPRSSSPREVIAESQADADEMDRALTRGGFQWPRPVMADWFPLPDAAPGPPSLSISTFTRLRARRASALSKLKQVDRAIHEIEAASKLGRWAGSGAPLAIHYLFAASADRTVALSVQELVKAHRLSKGQIARLRRAVSPAQTVDPDLALMVKVELNEFALEEYQRVSLRSLLGLDSMLMFSIPGEEEGPKVDELWPVDDPDLLDRRTTFALLAQATARALPALRSPWPQRDRRPDEILMRRTEMAPERAWEKEDREPRKDEIAAFRRAAEHVPNAFGLFKLRDEGLVDPKQVALNRLTYRALALGALAVEEGSRRFPLDPADLKPIRFDPQTRTLYSVGPNGKDERGRGDDVRMTL